MRRIRAGLSKFGGERFLLQLRGTTAAHMNASARSLGDPIPTLTAGGSHLALVEPFVIGQQSGAAPRSVSEPLPTIATAGAIALVEPFLVKYYGSGSARSVQDPLDTVTTRDRFGLVEPLPIGNGQAVDLLFRMLQPHELAAAMSFPSGYRFAGSREDQVKQIGNAVPVQTAAALCRKLLA
jgi:DNA (cytosine-5)-methyltransferase 1